MGPAKQRSKKEDSDTDHWAEGGVTYHSDFEENDEELADFLKAQGNFMAQMGRAGGFHEAKIYSGKCCVRFL